MPLRLAPSIRTTLAALALTACASSQGGGGGAASTTEMVGPQSPQRVDVRSANLGQTDVINVRFDPAGVEAVSTPVAASPARTWAALTSAYGDLHLTPDHLVGDAMTIGAGNARVRTSLAGRPLSSYIDCGSRMNAPIANTYEVLLTVRSQVKPRDAGSQLLTVVSATARPAVSSGSALSCTSTGELEKRIARMVAQQVAGK